MSSDECAGRFVMLTVVADRRPVFLSICNGAGGYLLKNTSSDRLLESIRQAHQGGSPRSPEVASQILTLFRKTVAPVGAVAKLTLTRTAVSSRLPPGEELK